MTLGGLVGRRSHPSPLHVGGAVVVDAAGGPVSPHERGSPKVDFVGGGLPEGRSTPERTRLLVVPAVPGSVAVALVEVPETAPLVDCLGVVSPVAGREALPVVAGRLAVDLGVGSVAARPLLPVARPAGRRRQGVRPATHWMAYLPPALSERARPRCRAHGGRQSAPSRPLRDVRQAGPGNLCVRPGLTRVPGRSPRGRTRRWSGLLTSLLVRVTGSSYLNCSLLSNCKAGRPAAGRVSMQNRLCAGPVMYARPMTIANSSERQPPCPVTGGERSDEPYECRGRHF